MPRSIGRLSASALSHHSLSSAAFITNIAESDFRYTQVPPFANFRAGACLDGIAPRRFLEAPRPADSKSTGRDLPPASANDAGASHALIRTLIAALEKLSASA